MFPPPHPLRDQLALELHARPFAPLAAPASLVRLCLMSGESAAEDDHAFTARLCARFGAPPPAAGARWHSAALAGVGLRWERHTEMSTYSFTRPIDPHRPLFAESALDSLPPDLMAAAPGTMLGGLRIDLRQGEWPSAAALQSALPSEDLAAASLARGAALAATDFRTHGEGFTRLALIARHDAPPTLLGRIAQRLVEIDTYRMAALLAFPAATEARAALGAIEDELAGLMETLAKARNAPEDDVLLARLTAFAAQAEALAARNSYRFAAGRAYHRLIHERLAGLDETPHPAIAEGQTLGEFLGRRLAPAMRTCDAVEARQTALVERIARATRLLATRVDVRMGAQNAALLKSMNERTRLQLRLQETVEGLSVFAIAYYALGLLHYLLEGLHALGAPVAPALLTGLAAPLIAGGLWLGLRHFRKGIAAERHEETPEP